MRWACCSCANKKSRSSFTLPTKLELRLHGSIVLLRGSAESNGVRRLRSFKLWAPLWHFELLNCPEPLHFNFATTHPAEQRYSRRVSAISLRNCATQFIHRILSCLTGRSGVTENSVGYVRALGARVR